MKRITPEDIGKMKVCSPLLGEPAATELCRVLDALEEAYLQIDALHSQLEYRAIQKQDLLKKLTEADHEINRQSQLIKKEREEHWKSKEEKDAEIEDLKNQKSGLIDNLHECWTKGAYQISSLEFQLAEQGRLLKQAEKMAKFYGERANYTLPCGEDCGCSYGMDTAIEEDNGELARTWLSSLSQYQTAQGTDREEAKKEDEAARAHAEQAPGLAQ